MTKPRLVIRARDPFIATLVPTLSNHPATNDKDNYVLDEHNRHPLSITKPDLCAHIEVEVNDDGEVTRQRRCFNRIHKGRHGFLCKMHHDLDYLNKTVQTGKTLERSEEQLREKMQREVEGTKQVAVHYRTYARWGWTKEAQAWEADPMKEWKN